MTLLHRLMQHLRRRRAARLDARAAIDAEAQALLATRSRSGALWELRERQQQSGSDRQVIRHIENVRAAVFRLSTEPPKADTATRMLYRDL